MRARLLIAWLLSTGCVLDLTGAPCAAATDCPQGQRCGAEGRCVRGVGPSATDLLTLSISPTNPAVPRGAVLQLLALGTYGDGSTQELTSLVTWSAASEGVRISNTTGSRGWVTALEKGVTEVTARYAGLEGRTVLFVEDAALTNIELTPTHPSIALNTTAQFVATGTYSDSSTQDLSSRVTWSSTQPAVGSVSNASGSKGLATALTQGTSTIRAALGDVAGQTLLIATNATLASLSITPTNPTRAPGTTQRFIATGRFSDGTTQDVSSLASWGSSNTSVATISNASESRGLAFTIDAGVSTINASLSGRGAQSSLTVSTATLSSLSVSPTGPSLARGSTLVLTATAVFSDATTQDVTEAASWRSVAPSVLTVSDEPGSRGLVTALSPGTAEVLATTAGVTSATTIEVTAATLTGLAVTPVSPTVGVGTTLAFTASGTYSDNTTQDVTTTAAWSSTDSSRLTVSNAAGTRGLGTGLESGVATVSATLAGVTGTTPVTVSGATLASISVSPASASLPVGSTRAFTAVGTFTDGSTQELTAQCTWASSIPSVATLSNADGSRGLATPLQAGSTSVTATLNGKQGSAALTVTAATLTSLTLSPLNATVPRGSTRQYSAQGTYSDGLSQDMTAQVTWASSAINVATVSNGATSRGLATTLATGATSVSASMGTVSASTGLTVTDVTLVSIAVSPLNATLSLFSQQQFTAVGTYSDGSVQPLTQQVTWTSSDPLVVAISNATTSKGRAFPLASGTGTISATLGSVLGQTGVIVSSTGRP
ncbi:MAG: Ig-like domain-containing protein [Archangium sp.]|nr:Ig-like domain-containing protein [Archangium sp.]